MTNLLQKLKTSKSGASAAEYALIISLIGLIIVGGAGVLGNSINNNYSNAASAIQNP